MTFRKDYLYYSLFLFPLLLFLLAPGYALHIAGMNTNGLTAAIILTPFAIISAAFIMLLAKVIPCTISLTPEFLIVDEFTPSKLPWAEILEISIVEVSKGGPMGQITWLVISFENNMKYQTKIRWLHKLNTAMLADGIAVCNLASYKGKPSAIVSTITTYQSNLTS